MEAAVDPVRAARDLQRRAVRIDRDPHAKRQHSERGRAAQRIIFSLPGRPLGGAPSPLPLARRVRDASEAANPLSRARPRAVRFPRGREDRSDPRRRRGHQSVEGRAPAPGPDRRWVNPDRRVATSLPTGRIRRIRATPSRRPRRPRRCARSCRADGGALPDQGVAPAGAEPPSAKMARRPSASWPALARRSTASCRRPAA